MSTVTEARYKLVRDEAQDGKRVERIILADASHLECAHWIHTHHSFSLDHACRYEGYRVIRKMTAAEQQAEYEAREERAHFAFTESLRKAPKAERISAKAQWADAMRHELPTITERITWLFQGSYGFGAQRAADRIIENGRMNQRAGMAQLIAACEWQCPQREAIEAWKNLTDDERHALDDAIDDAFARYSEYRS